MGLLSARNLAEDLLDVGGVALAVEIGILVVIRVGCIKDHHTTKHRRVRLGASVLLDQSLGLGDVQVVLGMSGLCRARQTKEDLDVLVLGVRLDPVQPAEGDISVGVQRTRAE